MTIDTTIILLIAMTFITAMWQEWQEAARTRRYVCRLKHHHDVMLEKARANVKKGVA